MNTLKKILIILSGIVLVILGFIALFCYFVGAIVPHPSIIYSILRSMLVLIIPTLIISGFKIFSFNEQARKFAVFSYVTVLSYTLVHILVMLPSLSSKNITDFIILLTPIAISIVVPIFFIVVLTTYNKRALILLAISILVLAIIFYPAKSYKAKEYKIEKEKVEQLIKSLQPQIRNDPRFNNVTFDANKYGVLNVMGTVKNQQDYDALKETASSYGLPKYVIWYVVYREDSFRK